MKIISRSEAKAAGLKRYFTGKPCKHGHVSARYVVDHACVECKDAQRRQFAAANPEKMRAYGTKWRRGNREKERARSAARHAADREAASARARKWRTANREKDRARKAAWYAANRERERQRQAEWRAENAERRNANEQRRRARKLNALCGCCTTSDFQSIYDLAHLAGFEVDHIEPLALGGKHCRHNLQLLTPDDHRAKTSSDLRRIAAAKRSAGSGR